MEEEISLQHDGVEYTAQYAVHGDTLTVYLPNGESRSTALNGKLNASESTAMVHLRSYVRNICSN
ncbi:hypothetical protein ACIOZM_21410 [Pseudomonas sp. NPDC087346]|uniref:hypothetical protein n=1 Tax=Pseudomonas sp. NPDC087346 TaxID=3364438 RepID=UPI0038120825